MAIYKRLRGFELGTTANKSSKLPERDSNSGVAGLRVRRADHSAMLPPLEGLCSNGYHMVSPQLLLQKQPTGELKPVAYASGSMTDTECRYAQIEKEALALTWALRHWRDCLIGRPKVKVETDHKPLVPLFMTKLVDELPLRIQSFRMRVMQLSITVEHVPGKLLYAADALSRGPGRSSPGKESDLETEPDFVVNAVMVTLPASGQRLDEIRCDLKKNDTSKVVMQYAQEGCPTEKRKLCVNQLENTGMREVTLASTTTCSSEEEH